MCWVSCKRSLFAQNAVLSLLMSSCSVPQCGNERPVTSFWALHWAVIMDGRASGEMLGGWGERCLDWRVAVKERATGLPAETEICCASGDAGQAPRKRITPTATGSGQPTCHSGCSCKLLLDVTVLGTTQWPKRAVPLSELAPEWRVPHRQSASKRLTTSGWRTLCQFCRDGEGASGGSQGAEWKLPGWRRRVQKGPANRARASRTCSRRGSTGLGAQD